MEFQIKGVKTSHNYNTFLMHKFRIKEGENEEVYSITQKFCIQIFSSYPPKTPARTILLPQ